MRGLQRRARTGRGRRARRSRRGASPCSRPSCGPAGRRPGARGGGGGRRRAVRRGARPRRPAPAARRRPVPRCCEAPDDPRRPRGAARAGGLPAGLRRLGSSLARGDGDGRRGAAGRAGAAAARSRPSSPGRGRRPCMLALLPVGGIAAGRGARGAAAARAAAHRRSAAAASSSGSAWTCSGCGGPSGCVGAGAPGDRGLLLGRRWSRSPRCCSRAGAPGWLESAPAAELAPPVVRARLRRRRPGGLGARRRPGRPRARCGRGVGGAAAACARLDDADAEDGEVAAVLPLALDLLAACLAGGACPSTRCAPSPRAFAGPCGERLERVAVRLASASPPAGGLGGAGQRPGPAGPRPGRWPGPPRAARRSLPPCSGSPPTPAGEQRPPPHRAGVPGRGAGGRAAGRVLPAGLPAARRRPGGHRPGRAAAVQPRDARTPFQRLAVHILAQQRLWRLGTAA